MFKKTVISVLASGILVGSCFAETHISGKQSIADAYAFSHQSVVDVRSILHDSTLYALLLALRAQKPEIETTAYHAMVLSLLKEIESNTRPSNKLLHINAPRISEGSGSIDVNKATWPKEAGHVAP